MKILDRYIIKTFFGPFLFIFSVLFFLFLVNVLWIQMGQYVGKGLTYWQISKLLFYTSASVVPLVLPLTILLASIMAFGNFGERYELAAMKAAGISLTRVMMPLFISVLGLAVVLFFFQNNIKPKSEKKAKNMFINIKMSKPALNFEEGRFINQIPGISVKFDKIWGENSENLEGVFIHKVTNSYEDQQAVVAKTGKFVPAENRNFLKLLLHNGYIYETNLKNKNYNERLKIPNQAIKFDTLVLHFDISSLINTDLEKEQITDDHTFKTYGEIKSSIPIRKKDNNEIIKGLSASLISNSNNYIYVIENSKNTPNKIESQYKLDTLKKEKQLEALHFAFRRIESQKNELNAKNDPVISVVKDYNKMIMHQQRFFAHPFTCIIFFLIGASLGSIIRKGGMGLPVVIAIVIFIINYVITLTVENFSWKGQLDPYLAAWLPNIILLPFGIWLTFKALTDSQLFDAEKYKALLKPIISKFQKNKEHNRYR